MGGEGGVICAVKTCEMGRCEGRGIGAEKAREIDWMSGQEHWRYRRVRGLQGENAALLGAHMQGHGGKGAEGQGLGTESVGK